MCCEDHLERELAILRQWGVVFGDKVCQGLVAQSSALGSHSIGVEAISQGVHVDVEAEVGRAAA